ncbi:MAG: hypothetical protein BMS9Abin33_1199 [Gammaproteobacteria bacterium]|nr:MAG: hypothetical protein BMS9Abin33_1199 [Gammaproteobacteria bacterium]
MKKLISILLVLLPAAVAAQNSQGMSEKDMQQMMQQMEYMQKCMQNIDQSGMKALEKRAKKFEKEVKSLCKKGQRDQAQKKAISFGIDMSKAPVMQEMKKCGEQMSGVMEKMPFSKIVKDYSNRHVCDE